MSDQQIITRELDAAQAADAAGCPRSSLDLSTSVGRLSIDLHEINSLAVAFTELSLRTDAFRDADPRALQETAERLSQQLSYLLEPIRPIEFDQDACVVQMRSQPPSREEEGICFYELVVSRSGLELARYQKKKAELRQRIPAEVTRQVLTRLAMDLIAAVQ